MGENVLSWNVKENSNDVKGNNFTGGLRKVEKKKKASNYSAKTRNISKAYFRLSSGY